MQQLLFEVKDTGKGIKPEDQANVFKILSDKGSISLGLTLCKEIATHYDGTLTFDSEFKKGSTFRFTMALEELEQGGRPIVTTKVITS
jgi:two-component system, NtrC family, nitrogen regulation sensor histidine kinase NtrY